jgi:hypothetical protein
VIDLAALEIVLGILTGWLPPRERESIAYLIEENRALRDQRGDVGYVSPTMSAVGWPFERTESAVGACGGSPRS